MGCAGFSVGLSCLSVCVGVIAPCLSPTALFLPALVPPDQCRSGAGRQPNSALCLAWSSAARNHYIALVPVKDRE